MMKKRILALLLTLVLLVSVMPTAFAAGAEVTAKVAGDTNVVKAGETVSVDVSIEGNPGIAYADWQLYYDNTAFEFVDYVAGAIDPIVNDTEEGGKPCVWVNFFATKNNATNGVWFTINFKAKTDAYNGEYKFDLGTVGIGDANDAAVDAAHNPAPVVITGGKDADPLNDIELSKNEFAYNGAEQAPVVTIKDMTEGDDYVLSGDLKATKVGTYTITATGKGHVQGTKTATWTIAPAEVTVSGIVAKDRSYVNGNKEVVVNPDHVFTGKIGSDDVKVVVSETATIGSADVGTYDAVLNVTLDGADKGNYKFSEASQKTASVKITKADAQALTAPEKGMLYSSATPYVFGVEQISGLAQDAGVEAVKAVSVSGSSNVKAELVDGAANITLAAGLTEANKNETAEVTITFSSKNYEDSTVKVPVKIIDKFDISNKIAFEGKTVVYTGETFKHETATTEVAGGEWTYTYAGDMTNAGTHKVTATYETEDSIGAVEVDFVITPAEMAAPTATATKVYDGTAAVAAEQVTVAMPEGAEYTVTVKSDYASADVAKSAGKVQIEVTLTGVTANNYDFVGGVDTIAVEADGKITAKAIAAEAAVSGSYTYTGSAVKAEVAVTSSEATLTAADYVVTYKNNVEAGEATAIVTSAADSNYKFAAETTFVIAKADVSVTEISVSKEYDGEGFNADNVYATVIFNDEEVDGEWTVTAGPDAPVVGNYTVDLKFVPENASLNEAVLENIAAVVEKATLGYGYTPVKKSGVSFDELDFVFLDSKGNAVDGTLTWFDGEEKIEDTAETKVEANKEYTFKFEPADSANFNDLEDTLVLYSVIVDGYPTNVIISATSTKHGSVTVNPVMPEAGQKVVVYVTPDAGYSVDEVIVTDESGDAVKVYEAGSNKYIFVMPAGQVLVKVIYDKAAVSFKDVAKNAWYADAVYAAVDMGLFTGVSENYFQPDGSMTRAMLVTVLWRLEGCPAAGAADFADVAKGAWYADAVAWANEEGIVKGMSATEFAPNASITREQMATMLYRYAKYLGLNTSARADLSKYADASSISAYAEDAMAWAVGSGLINGVTATTLNPAGTATRAQVATILVRFVDKYL